MQSRIPLARRNLLADPRRLIAGAAAVGLAIMLIMLLDGLRNGINRSVTAYEDNVGADLYLAQPGTQNFFGAVSQIPRSSVDLVRAEPDVNWASPVRTFLAIISLHDRKVPTSIIGWVPGQQGGPWRIYDGRAPQADNEVAVGRVMANRHKLRIGDSLEIMGRNFWIVGTSTDTFMLSFIFMTHASTDLLLNSPDTTSFVLIGTDRPYDVKAELANTGLAVKSRDEFASKDLVVMTRAYAVPIDMMRVVAFAIGILVIALSIYTAIMDRRREYGIVKAMGAKRNDLITLALRQSLILATLGLVVGSLFFIASRAIITTLRPQFAVELSPAGVARAIIATVFMAILASILPALRLAQLEPAIAYRGG